MEYKKRRKVKKDNVNDEDSQPSPFEIEVCKYLYRKLPCREGRISGCLVNYFEASNAVDCLLQSKWAQLVTKDKSSKSVHFANSDAVVRFMKKLVDKKLIGRAIKVKRKVSGKLKDNDKKPKVRKGDSKDSIQKDSTTALGTVPAVDSKDPNHSTSKEQSSTSYRLTSSSSLTRHKKPIRLEYTSDQIFLLDDKGEDECVYVWIYEAPPSLTTWLLGLALIVAVIACCAFPMWPWQARQGAYYVTLAALALLGLLLSLAALRATVYILLLFFSFGRMRLWLFPNFFADCGFIESFRPFYSLEQVNPIPAVAAADIGEKG